MTSVNIFTLDQRLQDLHAELQALKAEQLADETAGVPLTVPGGIRIELKDGVELINLKPQMVMATLIVASHFAKFTDTLTVT